MRTAPAAPPPGIHYTEEQWQRDRVQHLPREPLPPNPLHGRRFPAMTPADGCRQRIEALREVYRDDDWASNYYLAAQLVKLREAEQMERTGGQVSWRESGPNEAAAPPE